MRSHLLYNRRAPFLKSSSKAGTVQVNITKVEPIECSSPIIIAILGYIPDPRQGLISALFYDLQITNLDTRHREIGNFKLHTDGRTLLHVLFYCINQQSECTRSDLLTAFNARKTEMSTH
jgi:hypothetical protein